jgi:hypothetical protein
MKVLELAVREPMTLKMGDTEYKLVFPVHIIIALEDKLGHSMKRLYDWTMLKTSELHAVLVAGLTVCHPDEAEAVASMITGDTFPLETEAIEEIVYALCRSIFPRAMAKMEEEREKFITARNPGAISPNAEGAAVH